MKRLEVTLLGSNVETMPTIFLSHSSKDKDTARRIAVDLSMSDIRVWFDEWEIVIGESISQKISRGLEDSEFVVVLLSAHSVESGWVQKEWMSRIGEEAESKSVAILPVVVDDCVIPALLRDKRRADIREGYDGALRELIAAIRVLATAGKAVSAGARIQSGQIVFERTTPEIPLFRGLINTIEAGCFERAGRGLLAHIRVVSSHTSLQEISDATGLSNLTLESADYSLSTTPMSPTAFSCNQSFSIQRGTMFPDLATGRSQSLPVGVSGTTRTVVEAHSVSGIIIGRFSQVVNYSEPAPIPTLSASGSFRAVVAL
jgi:TIR domain-containing protein